MVKSRIDDADVNIMWTVALVFDTHVAIQMVAAVASLTDLRTVIRAVGTESSIAVLALADVRLALAVLEIVAVFTLVALVRVVHFAVFAGRGFAVLALADVHGASLVFDQVHARIAFRTNMVPVLRTLRP